MPRRPLTEELRAKARQSIYLSIYWSQAAGHIMRELPGFGRFDEVVSQWLRSLNSRMTLAEVSAQIPASVSDKVITRLLQDYADHFVDLGEKFLAAAEDAEAERLEGLLAEGVPVNYPDPGTGSTALHYVAAHGARRALRVLLKSARCDFLALDHRGRLAAELAGFSGRDLAMERLLLKNSIRQARAKGIPIEEIYRRDGLGRSALSVLKTS